MGKIRKWLDANYGWRRFLKLSLGVVPSIVSIELGISLVIGYLVALFFAGSRTKIQGRVPSLVFRVRQYRVHVHHWVVFSHVLVFTLVTHFFVITPLLFYGFLGGIVAQGVFHYEDWRTVIQKA